VRCLLEARFGTAEIVFPALQPADVRQFIAGQLAHRATPAKARLVASALRAYFRYRGACGNDVYAKGSYRITRPLEFGVVAEVAFR
jgi:integrase/recombinase XerC